MYIVEEGSSGVCVYSCCLNPSFLAALTPLSLELEVVSKPKLFWREVLDSNAEGSYARYEDLEGLGGARNPAQRDELMQLLAIIRSSYDSPEGILCQKVKDIDRLSEEILALLKEESYPSIQAFFERFDVDSHDDAGADVGGGSPRRGGASGGAGSAGAADGC